MAKQTVGDEMITLVSGLGKVALQDMKWAIGLNWTEIGSCEPIDLGYLKCDEWTDK